MDMYVSFYGRNLRLPVTEYLNLVVVIVLSIRNYKDLEDQGPCLTKLEKLVPHSCEMLGVDTIRLDGKKTPARTGMPITFMRKDYEQAMKRFCTGWIEGIIIYDGTTLGVASSPLNRLANGSTKWTIQSSEPGLSTATKPQRQAVTLGASPIFPGGWHPIRGGMNCADRLGMEECKRHMINTWQFVEVFYENPWKENQSSASPIPARLCGGSC